MFELMRSISIDVVEGRASAEAFVPADHLLFADHFPASRVLPGSLLLELAGQVSGPLAEEFARSQLGIERWAILGMVRDARFLRPVYLPASVALNAKVSRPEPSTINTSVSAAVNGERVMQAELVMMMVENAGEWAEAIAARNERLARWKEARWKEAS